MTSSLSETLNTTIDSIIRTFITEISTKLSIDETALTEIWYNGSAPAIKASAPRTKTTTTTTGLNNELLKLTKNELVEMCKAKKLKTSGSKQDLVQRIEESENGGGTQTRLLATKQAPVVKAPPVVTKLVAKLPIIQIQRNKFGNFEHYDTHLLFNNKTQKVYGRQNSDGSISQLTEDDIDLCNKFKFTYEIPMNLNETKSKMKVNDDKQSDDEELMEDEYEEVEVEEDEIEEDGEEVDEEEEVEEEEEYVVEDFDE